MGTLTGHLVPGAVFTLLGLWHLLNTVASYRLSGNSGFSSRTWFPSPFIKHLEPVILLLFSLLAATFLLLYPSSTSDHEHCAMFVHLAIYSFAALAADILPSPPSAICIVGILAASAFAQELFLLHYHSISHSGLEGHYHSLLLISVAACLVSTVATVGFPTSYVAAIVRSAAVALQGTWFVCTGLVLYGPAWILPARCKAEGGETVACAGGEAAAVAAANVQFSWVVAGVAAFTATVCLLPETRGVEYRKLEATGNSSGDGVSGLKQGQVVV